MAAGWVHYVQGEYADALADYRRALEGMPNDAEVIARIGYARRRLGDWPQVFEAYREAIRIAPDSPIPYRNLGMLLDRLGDREGARRALESCAALDRRGTVLDEEAQTTLDRLRGEAASR